MSKELVDSIIGVIKKEIEVYNKDLRGKSGKGEAYEQAWVDCLEYIKLFILGPIQAQEEREEEFKDDDFFGEFGADDVKEDRYKIELIIIEEEPDESGDFEYHGYCKNIKGIHVPGDTPEETLKNLGQAITAYSMSLIKDGDKLEDCIEE